MRGGRHWPLIYYGERTEKSPQQRNHVIHNKHSQFITN